MFLSSKIDSSEVLDELEPSRLGGVCQPLATEAQERLSSHQPLIVDAIKGSVDKWAFHRENEITIVCSATDTFKVILNGALTSAAKWNNVKSAKIKECQRLSRTNKFNYVQLNNYSILYT